MAKPNGGPAFPSVGGWVTYEGMTLRDYFAGQAFNALLSDARTFQALKEAYKSNFAEQLAASCYDFADAMLAAREKE